MYSKQMDDLINSKVINYMKIYNSNDIVCNSGKIDFNLFGINSLKTVQSCNRRNFYTFLSLPYKISSLFTDYMLDGVDFSSKDAKVNAFLMKDKEKLKIKIYEIIHKSIGIGYQPVDVVTNDKGEIKIALYSQNTYYPDTKGVKFGMDYIDIDKHIIKKIFKDDDGKVKVFTKKYDGNQLTTYTSDSVLDYSKETRQDESVIEFNYTPFFLFSNNIILGDNSKEDYDNFFDYIGRPEVYQVLQLLGYIIDLVTYTRIDIGKNGLPKITVPASFASFIQAQNQNNTTKPLTIDSAEFYVNGENGDKPEYITKDVAYLQEMRVAIDKMMYQISNILEIPPNKLGLQESGGGNTTATEIKKSNEGFYKRVQSKRVWFSDQIKNLLQYVAYKNTGQYAEVDINWKELGDNLDQAEMYISMRQEGLIDRRTATKMILNITDDEYNVIKDGIDEDQRLESVLFRDSINAG